MGERGRPREAGCGTATGYRRHYRLNEKPCDLCRRANADYQRGKKEPTSASRLFDALTVNDGWMNLRLAAEVLDVPYSTLARACYRMRSRGMVEMRVVGGDFTGNLEARVPTDESPDRRWTRQAACTDATVDFFDFQQVDEAKAICEACPVREACLTYSLQENLEGVWGGTTETERRKLLVAA